MASATFTIAFGVIGWRMEYNRMHMIKFIFGLVAIIVAVGIAYYYLSVKPITDSQRAQLQPAQQGAAANVEVRTNPIPPGAVMEDGTLPE